MPAVCLILNIISMLIKLIKQLFSKKIFRINMITKQIEEDRAFTLGNGATMGCWSEPDSTLQYLEILAKFTIPFFLGLKVDSIYNFLLVLVVISIKGVKFVAFTLMFNKVVAFNKRLGYIRMSFHLLVFFQMVVGLAKYFYGIQDNHEGYILVFLAPFLITFSINISRHVSFQILKRYIHSINKSTFPSRDNANYTSMIKNFIYRGNKHTNPDRVSAVEKLKVSDYEQTFSMLIDLTQSCLKKGSQYSKQNLFEGKQMSRFLHLIENHIDGCEQIDCICEVFEEFSTIFSASNQSSSEMIHLNMKKYKRIYELLSSNNAHHLTNFNLNKMHKNISTFSQNLMKSGTNLSREKSGVFPTFAFMSQKIEHHIQKIQEQQEEIEPSEIVLQADQLEPEDKEENEFFEVSYHHALRYFIVNFMKIFMDEIKMKNPNSEFIENAYNYSALFLFKKAHLAIVSLRKHTVDQKSSSNNKKSWTTQVSQVINEQFILHYFDLYITHKTSSKSIEKRQDIVIVKQEADQREQLKNQNIEYINLSKQNSFQVPAEKFIFVNTLYIQFHTDIELLCQSAIFFWKGFSEISINPFTQITLGEKLSKYLKSIYRGFLQIENCLLQKDPNLYFWFGLIQLKIVNDQNVYNSFIAKMREIQQFKKAITRNLYDKKFDHESGFMIADARVKSQGNVYMMNKHLCKWIKKDNIQVKNMNIKDIMPKLLAENHDQFMADYNQSGESLIINKKMTFFIRDSNQSLISVNFFVQFHYSYRYGHCFICLIDSNVSLKPFNDNQEYKVDHLVFISFDCKNGQILECSDNISKLIAFNSNIKMERQIGAYQFQERLVTLDDIFENLNFAMLKFHLAIQNQKIGKNSHEGIYKLDMYDFYEEEDSRFAYSSGKRQLFAKLALYIEELGRQRYQVGFAVFTIQKTKLETLDFQLSLNSNDETGKMVKLINNLDQIEEEEDHDDQASSSYNGSSNSSTTDNTNQFDIKQFHTFYQQNTPRILKLVVQLMIFLFISCMVISTINLALNIENTISTSLDINSVKASFDRINYTINSRMILRILLNIANGYETSTFSIVGGDRFQKYQSLLNFRISSLYDADYYLDNSGYSYDREFEEFIQKGVELAYINGQNQIIYDNKSLSVGQSLLITRLYQINNYTSQDMKGKLRVQTLQPNLTSAYQPSLQDQTIFFAVNNSIQSIRESNLELQQMYINKTVQRAENKQNQAIILCVVSIISILLVTLMISPIFSKTEERKFQALKFFIKLSPEKIKMFQERCEQCLRVEEDILRSSNNKFNQTHVTEGSRKLDQKLSKQDRMRSGYDINIDELSSSSRFDGSQRGIIPGTATPSDNLSSTRPIMMGVSMYDFSSQVIEEDNNSLDQMPNNVKQASIFQSHHKLHNQVIKQKSGGSISPQKLENMKRQQSLAKKVLKESLRDLPQLKKEFNSMDIHMIQQSENESSTNRNQDLQNSFNASQDGIDLNSTMRHLVNQNSTALLDRQNKNMQQRISIEQKANKDPDEEEFDEDSNMKIIRIKKLAFKKKIQTLVITLIVAAVFSQYYLLTFLLQRDLYDKAQTSVSDLNLIFNKESCIEDLLGFLRENTIQNTSLLYSKENRVQAADFLMKECQLRETKYNQMRKDLPVYLEDARENIEQMESSEFCEIFYPLEDDEYQFRPLCDQALNGILSKGITNVNAYMYQKAQKYKLNLEAAWSQKAATLTFLKQLLADQEMIELIDMKERVLAIPFMKLKNSCVDSVISYFKNQRNTLIIIYSVFISFVTLFLAYFFVSVLNRIRLTMWNTNIMVKIIPQDVLSKTDQEQIKSFFVN